MHVVFRERHGLEEADIPQDIGQSPADLVVLSFSDSDLGAFAAGWKRAAGSLPTLRLANLVALRHPISVDTYVERTLAGARAILVRLIGGEPYWAYGLASVNRLARERGLALAVLPADGRPDGRLDALSTVPVPLLRHLSRLCDAGGAVAAQKALAVLAEAAGLAAGPVDGATEVPDHGFYDPDQGVVPEPAWGPRVALVAFYRSYVTAADTGPVDALIRELRGAGLEAMGVFAPSLKAPGVRPWLDGVTERARPSVILNATAFSALGEDGRAAFDRVGCPVFQVALSTARKREWREAERGLSPADLAMHVVLPEVDGRLLAGVVSFKSPGRRDEDLQYSRFSHRADGERVAAAVARVLAWEKLACTPPPARRLAIVLSTYPGRAFQMAHAVGLDTLASTRVLIDDLAAAGYDAAPPEQPLEHLANAVLTWPVAAYRDALAALPEALRESLAAAWGEVEDDPAVQDGAFHFHAMKAGEALVALQPERGTVVSREGDYHDLSRTPRHAYVAFYLWLRSLGLHALIHMGAHGTLEWLPGKAVALSSGCWPEALTGAMPVIYPFIVNDPGEAAQAKRRIGAVTLGHLPPPLVAAEVPEGLARLERLLDEYANADGLDPARRTRLIADVREEARAAGVEEDLGLPPEASAAEAITRIDRFVCDIKESQLGQGLHVFGQGPCGAQERDGLLAALDGRRVAPGPAGSPYRGRRDVLPTGRNLYSVDPRAIPTPNAQAAGVKMAEEVLRRHLQDHGDWPRGLVVDLWGSATMRTAGEDFAMALHLAGVKPVWDHGSGRVTGFEILAPALLGRPRIAVTLRISGLFRDVFPGLGQLFQAATEALAERDEPGDENPYRQSEPRVFCPRPGQYGAGMDLAFGDFSEEARAAAGEAWLKASSYALGRDGIATADRDALEQRVLASDAFVHAQDLPETDLLLAADYAVHEAGFAAAAARLSDGAAKPALYHLDVTRPEAPRARSLNEEVARVVRARAANPTWADGMMAHGFRGAAEIAATLDHMAAFAHLAGVVPSHLFDLYHEATLGRPEVTAFMARENPAALDALRALFLRLRDAGLWTTRRNSIAASLEATP
ncbi:cobaltochelatase subunit CobN [Aquabacter sp. L1I39]|uniref:cobaltochelatase subunit CobN n=1 Tax=Aquabacter sp. L1I39 TaxID=2820278 RepID=UPI001ADA5020|nr:cobaltochelatase subunit CobN [Aquabacter sp. L1I39]QTL05590.1 cobaltochelatase subunit CobN [Aquabacter sp. L1I39]